MVGFIRAVGIYITTFQGASVAIVLIICITILIMSTSSKKLNTKWFKWESNKDDKTAHMELILYKRLVKEFKVLKNESLIKIEQLKTQYHVIFKDTFRRFLHTYYNEPYENMANNQSLKNYTTVLDFGTTKTSGPILIGMVFRNGFPEVPKLSCPTIEYQIKMKTFEDVCIKKCENVLGATEAFIDVNWSDSTKDLELYRKFFHEDPVTVPQAFKETIGFFKDIIIKRDEVIESIYNEYKDIFPDYEKCKHYCELIFRELFE